MSRLKALLLIVVCLGLGACASFPRGYVVDTMTAEEIAERDFLVAQFAERNGDPQEASRRYAAAMEASPDAMELGTRAVFRAWTANRPAEARAHAKAAHRSGERSALIHLTRGLDALKRNRSADAAQEFEAAKTFPSARALATALAAQNEAAKGVPEISPRLSAARVLQSASAITIDGKLVTRSTSGLAMALFLDPAFELARLQLGGALAQADDVDGALSVWSRVPPASPNYAAARGAMAEALLDAGRETEALKTATDATKGRPDDDMTMRLAGVYARLDRHGDSEVLLTRLIEKAKPGDAMNWRYLYARGAARAEQKNWTGARADLEAARRINPDHASILNYLGYLYVDRGENLSEALQMIQRAVSLEPKNAAYLDSLGWAYFQVKQYASAVSFLERAVQLSPGEYVLNDHLGDAYWHVGRQREARYQWKKAFGQNPDETVRAALELKLRDGLPPITQLAATPTTATP